MTKKPSIDIFHVGLEDITEQLEEDVSVRRRWWGISFAVAFITDYRIGHLSDSGPICKLNDTILQLRKIAKGILALVDALERGDE